jgi:tripartite-type tricarboxylate transporter receptor subunit TctC
MSHQFPTPYPTRFGLMLIPSIARRQLLWLVCLTMAWLGIAHAQPFPSRTVTLVLPSAPGDPTDLLARVLQPKLAERLGQQVVVENRPGGSAVIASNAVAKSAPDGHTVLMALSAHAINPVAIKSLPYDTLRDFAPVSLLIRFPLLLAAHPELRGNTLREMIDAARKQPGSLNFASPGTGTVSFMVGEEISRRSGINAVHLAFKGGGPAIQAMITNQAQFGLSAPSLLRQQVQAGKLKFLAVTSARRLADLPEVPTVAESGFPGFEVYNWIGLLLPGATPAAAINRLQEDVVAVMADSLVRQRLTASGYEVVASTPAELDRHIRREIEHWGRFVKEFPTRFD